MKHVALILSPAKISVVSIGVRRIEVTNRSASERPPGKALAEIKVTPEQWAELDRLVGRVARAQKKNEHWLVLPYGYEVVRPCDAIGRDSLEVLSFDDEFLERTCSQIIYLEKAQSHNL